MKRIILLLLLSAFFCFSAKAQEKSNNTKNSENQRVPGGFEDDPIFEEPIPIEPQPTYLTCATEDVKNIAYKFSSSQTVANKSKEFVVRVFYHFIKGNNFQISNPVQEAENMTIYLNNEYNAHGIYIENEGYDVINDERYVITTSSEFKNELVNVNKKNNAINIYINKEHYFDNMGGASGQANGILSTAFIIRKSRMYSSSFPHELGHCFGLYHPHQKWLSSQGYMEEGVNTNDWANYGDNVQDTPPDNSYFHSRYNSQSCVLTDNVHQPSGNVFNPDVHNFMSGYHGCRNRFTPGQIDRVKNFLSSSTVLSSVISSFNSLLSPKVTKVETNYVNYFGLNEVCDESKWKFEYQKGFDYFIDVDGDAFNFTKTQSPIVYTYSNSPRKEIKVTAIDKSFVYYLYRNCQFVESIDVVNLRTSTKETVKGVSQKDLFEKLPSGFYALRLFTKNFLLTKKIAK